MKKSTLYSWYPATKVAKGAAPRTLTLRPLGGSPVVITEGVEVDLEQAIGAHPGGEIITVGSMLDEPLRAQFKSGKGE